MRLERKSLGTTALNALSVALIALRVTLIALIVALIAVSVALIAPSVALIALITCWGQVLRICVEDNIGKSLIRKKFTRRVKLRKISTVKSSCLNALK